MTNFKGLNFLALSLMFGLPSCIDYSKFGPEKEALDTDVEYEMNTDFEAAPIDDISADEENLQSTASSGNISSETLTDDSTVGSVSTSNSSAEVVFSNPVPNATTIVENVSSSQPSCRPVRKYSYKLSSKIFLSCVESGYVQPFSVSIPDQGRAVAVMNGLAFNYQQAGRPFAMHSWTGSMSLGDQSYAKKIDFGAGESFCAYGSLALLEGATLDVWVEDSAAECQGKDIVAVSYFRTMWDKYGLGAEYLTYPSTNMTSVLSASMPVVKDASVTVLGQVEATTGTNYAKNRVCGSQYETGGAYLTSSGAYSGTNLYEKVLAPGGLMHNAYYPTLSTGTIVKDDTLNVNLFSYVNQTTNAGGYTRIGENYSGDSLIFMVQERKAD